MKRILVALSISVIGASFVTFAHAASFGIIPGAPARLGAGFSALSPQAVFPACIQADVECQAGIKNSISCISPKGQRVEPSVTTKFAPSTTFDVRQIKSKYDYFHELNITASVSGNYGAFGGSASFSFHSLEDLDQNSISWAITAKSDFGSYALSMPSMRPEYRGLKASKLLDTCGPEYIAEVDRGVLASVLYTFHSENERRLQEVSASLSAGIQTGAWGLNGSSSLKDVMKSLSSYGRVTVHVFAIGGEGSSTLEQIIRNDPTDLDKVRNTIADYVTKETADRSAILGFRTSSFGELIGEPDVDADYADYLSYLEKIGEYRQRLVDAQTILDQHLYHKDDFSDGAALDSLADDLNCETQVITQTAKNCRALYAGLTMGLTSGDPDTRSRVRRAFAFTNRPTGGFVVDNSGRVGPNRSNARALNSLNTCADRRIAADAAADQLTASLSRRRYEALDDQPAPQTCDFRPNIDLIAKISALPPRPFIFNYSFDDLSTAPVFADGTDVLYGQIQTSAKKASFVQIKDPDGKLLGMTGNDANTDHFGFAFTFPRELHGKFLKVQVTMTSGSSYDIVLDVPIGR